MNKIEWQKEVINIYGKACEIPRLSAWYADEGKSYEYSGIKSYGKAWFQELNEIKMEVERRLGLTFNSVLANCYRDGSDSVGWHSDSETELGEDPLIASVSFGQVRSFKFQHKKNKMFKHTIELPSGSLLYMGSGVQQHWRHQLPKSAKQMTPRINLTFRQLVTS